MSEWINNKFPEHMQRVIVFTNSGDVFDDHYYNAKLCHFIKNGEHAPTSGITHWQPLPRPPHDES